MIYSALTGFPHHLGSLPLSTELPPIRGRDEIEDWSDLLKALTARLRSAVGAEAADAPAESSSRLQQVVLECAGDLDILYMALRARDAPRHRPGPGVGQVIADFGESLGYAPIVVKGKPWWGKRPAVFSKIFG
ncbi:hypothetical protein QFZ42_001879 [Variovorax paradoxus]|uniref:hypothetical protein n=1 Tax=Variovorax paradoxus TaxID=34073 RepID=UPI0027945D61|nr:hypothetical protein [Variovorax paradoxus]MDQ0570045.1 hypothetical protein [Variovorax paradoxus]